MEDSGERHPVRERKHRQIEADADDPRRDDLHTPAPSHAEAVWERVPDDPADAAFGEVDYALAVLGAAVRKGVWKPAEQVRVLAVLGSATLDLRDAEILEGVTEISVLSVMGSVQIVVPSDLQVDVNGLGLMGSFPHRSPGHTRNPQSPLLRIRGLAVMGSVHVRVA